ncbi:MAG: hypothetical protein H8E37_09145 [Planctomycetes bacterium]|nr:hypothetical protein [Planctomycetota bacterium]
MPTFEPNNHSHEANNINQVINRTIGGAARLIREANRHPSEETGHSRRVTRD